MQDATLAKDARLAADTLFYAMLHDESCQAIVLEGLPVLHAQQGWPHDAGREGELRCMLLHAFNVQPLRYERNTFWGPVMRPEVAKLQARSHRPVHVSLRALVMCRCPTRSSAGALCHRAG